jgi:hypothetical protein
MRLQQQKAEQTAEKPELRFAVQRLQVVESIRRERSC